MPENLEKFADGFSNNFEKSAKEFIKSLSNSREFSDEQKQNVTKFIRIAEQYIREIKSKLNVVLDEIDSEVESE